MDQVRIETPINKVDKAKPWHENFPSPKAELRSISPDELVKLISDPSKVAGKDYLVVDVRRTDFAVPSPTLPPAILHPRASS